MNSEILVATTTLVALIGACSAFAEEGTQNLPAAQALRTESRADVKSEPAAAQRAGTDTNVARSAR